MKSSSHWKRHRNRLVEFRPQKKKYLRKPADIPKSCNCKIEKEKANASTQIGKRRKWKDWFTRFLPGERLIFETTVQNDVEREIIERKGEEEKFEEEDENKELKEKLKEEEEAKQRSTNRPVRTKSDSQPTNTAWTY